jgi:hypothetical protein
MRIISTFLIVLAHIHSNGGGGLKEVMIFNANPSTGSGQVSRNGRMPQKALHLRVIRYIRAFCVEKNLYLTSLKAARSFITLPLTTT